jgi:hypothetical protein
VNNPLTSYYSRVLRYCLFTFGVIFAIVGSLAADSTTTADYSFDTAGLSAKHFDESASIEFYPFFIFYNKASPFYPLKFGAKNSSTSDIYNLKAQAYLQYQSKPFLAFVSGALYGAYLPQDDSLYRDGKFFEGYLKYTPDASLSFLVGKRLYQWGKGYSFNPVSFAGRMKDLNDIDATLEGYWNISFEYVKSLDLPISSVALSTVVLPVYNLINKDYLPDKSVAGLAQLYMLAMNTDIDIYFFADNRHNVKTGLDFSRNIFPDWEIHSEWTFIKNSKITLFSDESTMVTQSHPVNNLVAGTRYLAPFNTTFIFEYLHVGSGYTRDEMDGYWNAINYAASSSNPRIAQSVLHADSKFINSQFLSTDYLFFKASHPDPFNFVYFTPSIYSIVNILDHSAMAGLEMIYSRSRNLLFTGRFIALLGRNESEYGSKPAQHRIELRAKWSF